MSTTGSIDLPLPIVSSGSSVISQTVYVSKAGSDVFGDGSALNPFLTIKKAQDSITDNSGDKLYLISIGPGDYAEDPSLTFKDWVFWQGACPAVFQNFSLTNIGRNDGNAIQYNFEDGDISLQFTNLVLGTGVIFTTTPGATGLHVVTISGCSIFEGNDAIFTWTSGNQLGSLVSFGNHYQGFDGGGTIQLHAVSATFFNDTINTPAFSVPSGPGSGSINVDSTNASAGNTHNALIALNNSSYARLQLSGNCLAQVNHCMPSSGQSLGIDGTSVSSVQVDIDGYPRVLSSTDLTNGAVASKIILVRNVLGRGNVANLSNFASGGSIGDMSGNYVVNIAQTTGSQVLTISSPIDTARAMVVKICNTGTAGFTLGTIVVPIGSYAEAIWNGTSWHYIASIDSQLPILSSPVIQGSALPPSNINFYASYASSINANLSIGSPTGTANGGAVISGGKLDLTGNAIKYVAYSATTNATNTQIGTINLKYTPNFNGFPPSTYSFFSIGNDIDDKNLITVHLDTLGRINVKMTDKNAVTLLNTVASSPIPLTSGTTYELELDYNLTGGTVTVFWDGVVQNTFSVTGTRDTNILAVEVGTDRAGLAQDAFFSDFFIFNTVQHTSGYSPPTVMPAAADIADFKTSGGTLVGKIDPSGNATLPSLSTNSVINVLSDLTLSTLPDSGSGSSNINLVTGAGHGHGSGSGGIDIATGADDNGAASGDLTLATGNSDGAGGGNSGNINLSPGNDGLGNVGLILCNAETRVSTNMVVGANLVATRYILNKLDLGDFAAGGSIGSAGATVDVSQVINIAQTTAAQTLTLPNPTDTTDYRELIIRSTGAASFTMLGQTMSTGKLLRVLWNSSAWQVESIF